MSIKDLIWVNVAQRLKLQREIEFQNKKREAEVQDLEQIFLALADIRTLAHDTNMWARIQSAQFLKNSKGKIKPFSPKDLPSVQREEQKRIEEETAGMTEVEKQIYLFEHGKKVSLK